MCGLYMTKIKICGLKTLEDALYAHRCGADALGFVIETPGNSPRNITKQDTKKIIEKLPPFAITVGVTMPENLTTAISIVETTGIDILQIHGDFKSQDLRRLKEKKRIRIIRSYSIDTAIRIESIIATIEEFIQNNVDAVLLDSKGEKGSGGTGHVHDWNISAEIRNSFDIPFLLAGGITVDNIEKAIDIVNPYAIDIASGVESAPGVKDKAKILEIIQKVRAIS